MSSQNLDTEEKLCLNKLDEIKNEKSETIWSKITLEPMWLGVTVSLSMGLIGFKNLFLQRACVVDLGHSEEECLHGTGEARYALEKESQMIVATYSISSSLIGGFFTCILLVFLGPWSDSSGRRKPLIILPILGMLMTSLLLLIVQAFPNISTGWVIYAEVLPLAIGGNFTMLLMASFNYLGDICYKTGKCPTLIMGSNSGFISLFAFIGSLLAPFLYRAVGFTGLFAISLTLELTSLIYALYKVQDINVAKKIPSILDWTLPLKAVKCVFKKREGLKRRIIILMVIVPCCNTIVLHTDLINTYMYLRQKFNWTEMEYSILISVKSSIHVLGTFIIITLFKKRYQMSERLIGILGGTSQFLQAFTFMFCSEPWMIFATSIFGIFARGAMIAERPVLNRQIEANEQGKVNCVTAIIEKFVSFIATPLANFIYLKTLHTYPRAYIIMGIIAGLIQLFCYVGVKEEPVAKEMETKNLNVEA